MCFFGNSIIAPPINLQLPCQTHRSWTLMKFSNLLCFSNGHYNQTQLRLQQQRFFLLLVSSLVSRKENVPWLLLRFYFLVVLVIVCWMVVQLINNCATLLLAECQPTIKNVVPPSSLLPTDVLCQATTLKTTTDGPALGEENNSFTNLGELGASWLSTYLSNFFLAVLYHLLGAAQ